MYLNLARHLDVYLGFRSFAGPETEDENKAQCKRVRAGTEGVPEFAQSARAMAVPWVLGLRAELSGALSR